MLYLLLSSPVAVSRGVRSFQASLRAALRQGPIAFAPEGSALDRRRT